MNNILILCDASYDLSTRFAGFGIVDTATKVEIFESFHQKVTSSNEAEIFAILSAIDYAKKQSYGYCVIASDSQSAIKSIDLKFFAGCFQKLELVWVQREFIGKAHNLAKKALKIQMNDIEVKRPPAEPVVICDLTTITALSQKLTGVFQSIMHRVLYNTKVPTKVGVPTLDRKIMSFIYKEAPKTLRKKIVNEAEKLMSRDLRVSVLKPLKQSCYRDLDLKVATNDSKRQPMR